MIAFISSGEIIGEIVSNPSLISYVVLLAITLLYSFFAVRVWVQVRRLERWLPLLQGHWFSVWALAHVALAFLGFGLALVILWPY